ncbi:MAG: GGDEF domain-containing protein [Treponema sp.]
MQALELSADLINQAKTFLPQTSFFSGWTNEELDEIMPHTQIVTFENGGTIFTPEENGSRIYLLLHGSVEIFSPDKKSLLAAFVSGELFGEIALLTRKPHDAFAIAHKEACLLEFPKDGLPLETVFNDKPRILAHLFQSLLIFTAQRTRAANMLIKENSPVVQELRNQVYNDKLSGLFNRTYLEEYFSEFCKNPFALIMFKPDNFKYINDTYGHEVGDTALVAIAAHLKKTFSDSCILARYEGNEYALITHTHTDKETARSFAETVKKEFETLDLSRLFNGENIFLSISVGVVLYPVHGKTYKDIVTLCSGIPLTGRQRGGSMILFPEEL